MEQHKNKLTIDTNNIPTIDLDYLEYFRRSHKFAFDNYGETIARIQYTKFEDITLELFFREYIWCVMVSGFNAKVVSRIYDNLIAVYQPLFTHAILSDHETIPSIMDRVRIRALEYCNNKRKVDAIFKMADILHNAGGEDNWDNFKLSNLNTPDKLQLLPFIGPITKNHLARNIGILDVVKEDLHLVRIGKHWGFNSGLELCKKIKEQYDLPLGIIDLIFWYSASQFGTLKGNNDTIYSKK